MSDQKKSYALFVEIVKSNCTDATHFHGRLVVLKDGPKIESVTFDTPREDIAFSARLDDYKHGRDGMPAAEPWAVEYGYQVHGILKASEMAERAKFMNAVVRKMDSYYQNDGPTKLFGQFVLRLSRALGANGIIRKSPREDWDWQHIDTGNMIVHVIDSMVYEWQKANGGVPVAAE